MAMVPGVLDANDMIALLDWAEDGEAGPADKQCGRQQEPQDQGRQRGIGQRPGHAARLRPQTRLQNSG